MKHMNTSEDMQCGKGGNINKAILVSTTESVLGSLTFWSAFFQLVKVVGGR